MSMSAKSAWRTIVSVMRRWAMSRWRRLLALWRIGGLWSLSIV